ncbi:Holliday junction resolvase, partial [Candidatus Woesearchaeota archaeon]|nr:Holliday junction resolvase [Candidatus Woesearchaeota archaeon]
MSVKSKGINAERELIHLFWQNEWAAVRIAGSGSSQYPSAYILASNAKIKLAIEAKLTKDQKKYFSKQEIEQLKTFSAKFGAEPWIAVKFKRDSWYFLKLADLEQTSSNFVISTKLAKNKGLSFKSLINSF